MDDAAWQYKTDRNPREKLFELGHCVAHFAVDEGEVRFCTHLKGKASWFLPFNRGWNDGAGNPPNPNGIKTDYLWREVLTRESLTNILENYAGDDVRDEGRHRAVQAVHGQRRLQALDDRYGVRACRPAGGGAVSRIRSPHQTCAGPGTWTRTWAGSRSGC